MGVVEADSSSSQEAGKETRIREVKRMYGTNQFAPEFGGGGGAGG